MLGLTILRVLRPFAWALTHRYFHKLLSFRMLARELIVTLRKSLKLCIPYLFSSVRRVEILAPSL